MTAIRSICVFCGSSFGDRETYRKAAEDMGRMVAERGLELVYGGGHVGLMGIVADGALNAGGQVTGIIPVHLRRAEVEHQGLTRLIEVDTMFARKAEMIRLADAFVSLPGGIGTIDEAIEVITLRQLGQHNKPSLFVDIDGYWAGFAGLLDHVIDHHFARSSIRDLYAIVPDVPGVFDALGL
jgi:uncharacterized protein (TIGR00730 family)